MDEMTKIAIEATERMDEFMFRVMQPYCEDVSEMKISKDDLRDALTLWSREKKKSQRKLARCLRKSAMTCVRSIADILTQNHQRAKTIIGSMRMAVLARRAL